MISFDERRHLFIPGNAHETILFAVHHLLSQSMQAIESHGFFAVAFSGGQTPQAIFQELAKIENRKKTEWDKWLCFWSDERNVPLSDPDSNYGMAMRHGLSQLPFQSSNLFPMEMGPNLEESAEAYEEHILSKIPSQSFDFVMLGVGEDGHTASLFPRTAGLHVKNKLVIANYIPQKHVWRLSFTYQTIQEASLACFYAIGLQKSDIVAKVLTSSYDPENLPAQKVGTSSHPALWILDRESASKLPGIK